MRHSRRSMYRNIIRYATNKHNLSSLKLDFSSHAHGYKHCPVPAQPQHSYGTPNVQNNAQCTAIMHKIEPITYEAVRTNLSEYKHCAHWNIPYMPRPDTAWTGSSPTHLNRAPAAQSYYNNDNYYYYYNSQTIITTIRGRLGVYTP